MCIHPGLSDTASLPDDATTNEQNPQCIPKTFSMSRVFLLYFRYARSSPVANYHRVFNTESVRRRERTMWGRFVRPLFRRDRCRPNRSPADWILYAIFLGRAQECDWTRVACRRLVGTRAHSVLHRVGTSVSRTLTRCFVTSPERCARNTKEQNSGCCPRGFSSQLSRKRHDG